MRSVAEDRGLAKQYDATSNSLLDAHATDRAGGLAGRCGVPIGAVTPLDTDLSATFQPDRLFCVDGPAPVVLHLELESSSRLGVRRDPLRYNAFVHHQTERPMHSVLLRPKANASDQISRASGGFPGWSRRRSPRLRSWVPR